MVKRSADSATTTDKPVVSVSGGKPGGELLAGVGVAAWVSQAWLAEVSGYDARHIQRLEKRGLPSRGAFESKEYPVPHVIAWLAAYYNATHDDRQVIEFLDLEVALARQKLAAVELQARRSGNLQVRDRERG